MIRYWDWHSDWYWRLPCITGWSEEFTYHQDEAVAKQLEKSFSSPMKFKQRFLRKNFYDLYYNLEHTKHRSRYVLEIIPFNYKKLSKRHNNLFMKFRHFLNKFEGV